MKYGGYQTEVLVPEENVYKIPNGMPLDVAAGFPVIYGTAYSALISKAQIREKEISVFTDNFAVLSTQSAFLTGLGFGGLTMVPTWHNDRKVNGAFLLFEVS